MTDKELEEKRADAKRRWELLKQHKREMEARMEKDLERISALFDAQARIRNNIETL